MKWIAGAKYISPPIEQSDLVSTTIKHYPTPLGMAIRGRGPRDTNELLSVLMEFEESASFCERRREETNTPPGHPSKTRSIRINSPDVTTSVETTTVINLVNQFRRILFLDQ